MYRRKVVIRAIEAVNCIRDGMDDVALMRKYNLSAEGLQTMMRELIAVGVLRQDELEARPIHPLASVTLDGEPSTLEPKARKKRSSTRRMRPIAYWRG